MSTGSYDLSGLTYVLNLHKMSSWCTWINNYSSLPASASGEGVFDSYEDVVARNQMLSTNWTMCVYNTIHIFIDGLLQCSPQDFLIGYGVTRIASFLCREHITPTPASMGNQYPTWVNVCLSLLGCSRTLSHRS